MSSPPASRSAKPDAFSVAVAFVLRHEGGYVNDPADPGGETKFGISKRSYPDLDIRGLTEGDAELIYLRDFWIPLLCDQLPAPLPLVMLDTAVNCGPRRAARWLQSACGAPGDGVMGPVTVAASATDPVAYAGGVLRRRMAHCRSLPGWIRFGPGWAKRMRELAAAAGVPLPA